MIFDFYKQHCILYKTPFASNITQYLPDESAVVCDLNLGASNLPYSVIGMCIACCNRLLMII
jgi:hypothetical protein